MSHTPTSHDNVFTRSAFFLQKISSLIILALCSFSCNHVFYQPSRSFFFSPTQQGITFSEIEIKTHDGLTLAGWVLSPPQPELRSAGTILQFHGNGENMTSHFIYLSWLVKSGYTVYTFDYRGYGKSEGSPSREGLVLDGAAAIQFACDAIHSPPLQQGLVIMAQSLGGAVAPPAIKIAHRDSCIRGLILDSAFSSYRSIARKKLASVWLTWALQWPLSFLVTDDLSPVDSINDIKAPILFIHSLADPIVPYSEGKQLSSEWKGATLGFWSIAQPGHTFAFAGKEKIRYKTLLKEILQKLFPHQLNHRRKQSPPEIQMSQPK